MPDFPGVLEKPDRHPDPTTKTYTIEVITPLFGGGYEAGKVDPQMPIRASSIRGHLRFWWRATRGANYATVGELRQREGEIWGSMENPSPVVIEIHQPESSSLDTRSYKNDFGFNRFGSEAYALFSAKENDATLLKEGFKFQITIHWISRDKLQNIRDKENAELKKAKKTTKPETIEDIEPDILAALVAWVNFGGIGARTRRGCGALYCEELAFESIKDISAYPFKVHYKSALENNALKGWAQSVESIQSFRQSFRGQVHQKMIHTRNGVRNIRSPGRSFWPEPDSIRNLTQCALQPPNLNNADHSTPLTNINYFPRAELGLPILFHFGDGPRNGRSSRVLDPPDTMLIPTKEGKNGTRMASPIITRPLKMANGDCYSVIVVLKKTITLPPLRLVEVHSDRSYNISSDLVKNSEISNYDRSPLGSPKKGELKLSSSGSAIEGYLAYIKSLNFTEVKP